MGTTRLLIRTGFAFAIFGILYIAFAVLVIAWEIAHNPAPFLWALTLPAATLLIWRHLARVGDRRRGYYR